MFQRVETYTIEDEDVMQLVNRQEGNTTLYADEVANILASEQEYGTDCYLKVDISDKNIHQTEAWLYDAKSEHDAEYEELLQKRLTILRILRQHIPLDINFIFMHVSY